MTDPGARAALNAIVHPEVQRRRDLLIAEATTRGDRIVVSDIPLLFEVLDPSAFDAVVLVDAPPESRLQRIMRERSLSRAEAEQMIAAQMPAEEKRAWGARDPQRRLYVIENSGTPDALEHAARKVWIELEGLAARR
jgi:dephospho-CoA kinase